MKSATQAPKADHPKEEELSPMPDTVLLCTLSTSEKLCTEQHSTCWLSISVQASLAWSQSLRTG